MRAALLEIFPEAVEMGADRLAKAAICHLVGREILKFRRFVMSTT